VLAPIDFVGSLSEPPDGEPYGCPVVFDQDHEGWLGYRVEQVIDEVTPRVEVLQPDVALIHLGTNDLSQRQGPVGTAEELESFVTGLQAAVPDITVLVAQIIPCDDRRGGLPELSILF
jgi:lysophospholipase L1-like esterase